MVAARSALRATQNGGGDGGSPVSPEGPLPAARSAPSPPRSRGAPPVCWEKGPHSLGHTRDLLPGAGLLRGVDPFAEGEPRPDEDVPGPLLSAEGIAEREGNG
ncbi:uncharacterized protein LOC116794659 isoform X2 [Chiroxiphia lanceolata]|uniref:uncharacterized protein LOC116794659 isoform X2 n=1 Tax=Chiroxiphia lanceolata TaxID=296741 RepID=UPI0013CE95CA|nr:uncharacterized protein LOC116794659 isoform X2 [Chiroxiphia lanceolata]